MRITADFNVDYNVLPEPDLKLVRFLSRIPYFVRRFFIVTLETEAEEAFLEFYTAAGFGEYCEGYLIRLKMSDWGDGITRVILCNYIGDCSSLADQITEYLEQFEWSRKKTDNPLFEIDLFETAFDHVEKDSDIYLNTVSYIKTCGIDFDVEAVKMTPVDFIKQEEEYKKEYVKEIHRKYEDIEVDFLAE